MNLKNYLILIGTLGTLERVPDANLSSILNDFFNNDVKQETIDDMQSFMGTFKTPENLANSIVTLIKTEMPEILK